MGWWSGTDKDTGEKVSYKQGYDSKDGSYRHEKLTHHDDGSHTHEVTKSGTDGGLMSFIFGSHRDR